MSVAEPVHRRWTVEEYERAAESGVFSPDERLELIEGEIFAMSPQKGPHVVGTLLTRKALGSTFEDGWVVLIQMPLRLCPRSAPEPDLAVVRGQERDFVDAPPTTAELVVEVADSTLTFDRTRKAALYARAVIPEYWILNLPERLLEVHRHPDRESGVYQEIVRLDEAATVSPLAAPAATIAVRDLLP